MLN
ncbi:Protein of unknown function [Bacillus toyonensis]|jgi:steroid delta-isomerase-like uncharacterized protein